MSLVDFRPVTENKVILTVPFPGDIYDAFLYLLSCVSSQAELVRYFSDTFVLERLVVLGGGGRLL